MARPYRLDQEETFYHIVHRGNEQRVIFRDDRDRQGFLDRLGRCSERFELDVYAYVLMTNHYHLLVRTQQANLSRAMQWLGGAYSIWHNKRHQRSGHLFQGRFKSFVVAEKEYLQRLLCYIHRNPLRAGMVETLKDYLWSSYPALAYGRHRQDWFDRDLVYEFCGLDARSFRRAVSRYDESRDDLLSELCGSLILGSQEVIETFKQKLKDLPAQECPQLHQVQSQGEIEERVDYHRNRLEISQEEFQGLLQPIRRENRPLRDVLIYLLWRDGCYNLTHIGDLFNVGYTTASLAKARGANYVKKNRKVRRLIDN